MTATPPTTAAARRTWVLAVAVIAVLLGAVACGSAASGPTSPPTSGLPLTAVATAALPGDTSRLDYASIDPAAHRLFIAQLGASQIIEVDTGTNQVVKVIDRIPHVVATVDVGGDAGNVAYDPAGQILVAVQSRNQVAVIDPATFTVTRRIEVPGCDHPHGLTLDTDHRLGFIACDGNATVYTLDLDTYQTSNPQPVGADPDVLVYDPGTALLSVAAESGDVTVLTEQNRHLSVLGRDHLADGAHVVAVDPTTHRSYYPIASGPGGRPVLLVEANR